MLGQIYNFFGTDDTDYVEFLYFCSKINSKKKINPGNEVAYLITDLNRNGRYELIRSERLADNPENTEFCRNRFFEINEDYSGIYKMEYEVETMWANGELSGWSPSSCRWRCY